MNGGAAEVPGATGRIRVAVVDDHRMVLDGLRSWITEAASDIDVVAAVTSWTELLAHPEHPAQVVLLDLDLRDGLPLSAKVPSLKAAGCAVVVVSAFAEPAKMREALEAGALGYVPKNESGEVLVRAVRAAAQGTGTLNGELAFLLLTDAARRRPPLSRQERRALCLYVSGLKLSSVARRLGVSDETAKSYLKRVREKYARAGREARTKLELYQRAVEDGLLDEDEEG